MHDLMHDIAKSVAGEHFGRLFPSDAVNSSVHVRTLHLSVDGMEVSAACRDFQKARPMRTLMFLHGSSVEKNALPQIVSSMRYLRALDLIAKNIKTVPKSFGRQMRHLRYLDISKTSIELLPNSICYLQYLKVLIVGATMCELPKTLNTLGNLMHLDIRQCNRLNGLPVGLDKLKNLIRLTDFICGDKNCSDLTEIRELKLCVELFIRNLERARCRCKGALVNKDKLASLRLSWTRPSTVANNDEERLLGDLRPPENLKRLRIYNYSGTNFPLWLANARLPYLKKLMLVNCKCCSTIPSFGSIESLVHLQILGMDSLNCIGVEFYGIGPVKGFPSLEFLVLHELPNLERWSSTDEHQIFPNLATATISACPRLVSLPSFPNINRIEISDSNSELLSSLANLSSLSSLLINRMQHMESLPAASVSQLKRLKKFTVSDCNELQSLPLNRMQHLRALEQLTITGCMALESVAFLTGQLTSLRSLTLQSCPALVSLPMWLNYITSMRSLKIVGCRNITWWTEGAVQWLSQLHDFRIEVCNDKVQKEFPHWLRPVSNLLAVYFEGQHWPRSVRSEALTENSIDICCCRGLDAYIEGLPTKSSFEDVKIEGIPDIMSLPESIGDVQTLKYLSISSCSELQSLPRTLRGLALNTLSLQGCPQAESRCRPGGEDWGIVSHVETIILSDGTSSSP